MQEKLDSTRSFGVIRENGRERLVRGVHPEVCRLQGHEIVSTDECDVVEVLVTAPELHSYVVGYREDT